MSEPRPHDAEREQARDRVIAAMPDVLDVVRSAYETLETYGGHIGGCPGADAECRCGWREERVYGLRKREALDTPAIFAAFDRLSEPQDDDRAT